MSLEETILIRFHNTRSVELNNVNGDILESKNNVYAGAFCKVKFKKNIGFSRSRIDEKNIINYIITTAISNSNSNIHDYKKNNYIRYFEKFFYSFIPCELKEQNIEIYTHICSVLDKYITTNYPNLFKRFITIKFLEEVKEIVVYNSYNNFSHYSNMKIYIKLSIKNTNNDVVEFGDSIYLNDRLENIINKINLIYYKIDSIYNNLVRKSKGIYATEGLHQCILSSEVTGVLIHEALGHMTEADIVANNNMLYEFFNKEKISNKITIMDFANTAYGIKCPIPMYIDDEGVECTDVTIIKNGVLKNYIHNSASALIFKTKPKGNARAPSFFHEPLIRMRNTCMLPGLNNFNDMISSINDGYYLIKASNGKTDSNGNFNIKVTFGYQIKGGKLYKPIKDVLMYGNTLSSLLNIDMISQNFRWSFMDCTKKQNILVGIGAPEIKCTLGIKTFTLN